MYCEQCGKRNEDGKTHCFSCGAPLVPAKKKGDGRAHQNKPAENRPAENKPVENKPVENKPAKNKPVKNKPVEVNELDKLEKELDQLSKRKPVTALIFSLLILAAVLVLLVGKIPKLYGPQKDAEGFETAFLSGKWEEAYSYLFMDGETSPFLSKDTFVNVMSRTGAVGYRDLELQEMENSGDLKVYSISYESMEGPKTGQVILHRTDEKKLLFLNVWKVDPASVCSSNVTVSVPIEASLLLNGMVPEAQPVLKSEEHAAEYTFDKLFSGVWTAELQAENRAPYEEDITVTAEGESISLVEAELKPDQELMDQLLNQFAQDYQAILTASVNREDFSVVENYFATQAREEGRAQNMYANACSQAYDPARGSGILRYEMSDISAKFVPTVKSGYASEGDLVMEITSLMNYAYIDGGMEKMDTQKSVGLLCYHQENGQWKIQSFS